VSRMAKRRVKKTSGPDTLPRKAVMAVRSFALSHIDGHDERSLKLLQAYLQDNHHVNISLKDLDGRVSREKKGAKTETVLKEIDSILFSPTGKTTGLKLGSAFCTSCGMFKNYRKECPYCGHHEMTV